MMCPCCAFPGKSPPPAPWFQTKAVSPSFTRTCVWLLYREDTVLKLKYENS